MYGSFLGCTHSAKAFTSQVLGCTALVLLLVSSVLADSSCASYTMGLIN